MNRLTLTIMYLNLIGLAVTQGLESWQWGTISSVLPMTWLWIGSVLTIGAAILVDRSQSE